MKGKNKHVHSPNELKIMSQPFSGFVVSIIFLALAFVPAVLADSKENTLSGGVSGDITGQNATVSWSHTGTTENPFCNESLSGDGGSFTLGDGQDNSVTNSLCGQRQTSSWDVKAMYDKDTKKTTFTKNNQLGTGTGTVTAGGALNIRPGTTSAETTLSSTGKVNFKAGAKITIKSAPPKDGKAQPDSAAKDDAVIHSVPGGFTQAAGSQEFLVDGSVVLQVDTLLFATNGARATIITPEGLRLYVAPGQSAGFSAEEINNQDPSQNLAWSVVLSGSTLSGSGIDLSLFRNIAGGEFLPWADMPGTDITANVGDGSTLEYDDSAFYFAEGPGETTPEPSSLLLLGTAILSAARLLRKRLLART